MGSVKEGLNLSLSAADAAQCSRFTGAPLSVRITKKFSNVSTGRDEMPVDDWRQFKVEEDLSGCWGGFEGSFSLCGRTQHESTCPMVIDYMQVGEGM